MLTTINGARPVRLVVVAYDITCPRRAYRVRSRLAPLHHAKQYSVFETLLSDRQAHGLLGELADCCDFAADRLVAWWPHEGLRLHWRQDRLTIDAQAGEPSQAPASLATTIGNFMICYDISEARALRAVADEVAPEAAMIQRSVYWLRQPVADVSALLVRCAPHLAADDRLWVYPLRASHDLHRIGDTTSSVLPIATHRWRLV